MIGRHGNRTERRPLSAFTSDAYQVDVMFALFAILLILLLISVAQVKTTPPVESQSSYRPVERQTTPFQLRSMAPTYPYRTIWIVKDDQIVQLDMLALARRYRSGGVLQYREWLPPMDITIGPVRDVIDNFRLDLAFSGAGIPDEVVKRSFPLSNPATVARAMSDTGKGALLYVWEQQLAALQPVLEIVRNDGLCHKVVLNPARYTVSIMRDYSDFVAEKVLRCY